jgi:hypothetical protein
MNNTKKELQGNFAVFGTGVRQALTALNSRQVNIGGKVCDQLEQIRAKITELVKSLPEHSSAAAQFRIGQLLKNQNEQLKLFGQAINGSEKAGAKQISKWLLRDDEELCQLLKLEG